MGGKVSSLVSEDIAELKECSHFSAREIEELYRRFERLDRDRSGSLSAEELLAIPEFAMNPLAPRILEVILRTERPPKNGSAPPLEHEELSFLEFIKFLSIFHRRAPSHERLSCTQNNPQG